MSRRSVGRRGKDDPPGAIEEGIVKLTVYPRPRPDCMIASGGLEIFFSTTNGVPGILYFFSAAARQHLRWQPGNPLQVGVDHHLDQLGE